MTNEEYRSKSEMRRVEYMKANDMTHDELLARIDDQEFAYDNLGKALIAVVELHKPFDFTMGGEPYLGCNCGQEYPCPTIQAIQEMLK